MVTIIQIIVRIIFHWVIIYRYWLHERVSWEFFTLRKTMSTEAKPKLTFVSRDDNFPCYPLVPSIFIIFYWMLIKYIVCITFGIKTIKVKWIFEFVFRTSYIQTLIQRQSKSLVNRSRENSAQTIFLGLSAVVKQ